MTTNNNQAWYQQYAPTSVENYVFENSIHKTMIMSFIDNGGINGNLLLTGAPGTGKTSIATLLIRALITHENNYRRVKARSVVAIEELGHWLKTRPVGSGQKKIVLLEEFDKLSTAAVAELKDTLMEQYQSTVSFIATTNYKQKIDTALLSRFNHQLTFTTSNSNVDGIVTRCEQILTESNIPFEKEDVVTFVNSNKTKGLRDILSALQLTSISGTFDLSSMNKTESTVSNSTDEFVIVNLMFEIITIMIQSQSNNDKVMCYKSPTQSIIANQWGKIQEIVLTNTLSYDLIYNELAENVHYAPLYEVLDEYMNPKIDKVIIAEYVKFLAFVSNAIKSLLV